MSTFLSSRWGLVVLSVLSFLVAVALTLGGVNLTRAGLVSVLPVTSQQSGISVCGHGKAKAAPDRAQLALGVFARAATAQQVRDKAAQAMTDVLAFLKSSGVADQDLQTGYVAIQPQYSYTGNTPQIVGYAATNTVTATIHDLKAVGAIIDGATARGGNHIVISGITFSAGDPSQAQVEAQKDAVADANRQAEQVAASAGASLGQAISIQVGSCGNTPSPVYYGADKAAPASGVTTPIQPGQLDITVDVAVVYALR